MALESGDTAQWIAGAFAAIATFMLKHLHGKVQEAASKADLAEAMKRLADQRLEDMQRYETYRRERLNTEYEIFERLGGQDKTLARIDERTARMSDELKGMS